MISMRTLTVITAAVLLHGTLASLPAAADEPTEAQVYADRNIAKLAAWKYKATSKDLENKKELFGDSAGFKTAWGLVLACEGNLDEAAAELKRAVDQAPADPAPALYRGWVLYWNKKTGDATGAWQKAHDRAKAILAATPDDARASYYMGASLVALKKFSEARPHLKKALDEGFVPSMTHYQIGLSHAFAREWQPAKNAFDAAIAADHRYAYAFFFRGMVWDELKRKDNMLLDMDQFVKLAPTAPDADKARAILAAAGR